MQEKEAVTIKTPCGISLLSSMSAAIQKEADDSCLEVVVTTTSAGIVFTFVGEGEEEE